MRTARNLRPGVGDRLARLFAWPTPRRLSRPVDQNAV